MLADKKARGTTRMNIVAEKARLVRERDHAQEVGDVNEIERCACRPVINCLLLHISNGSQDKHAEGKSR